MVSAAPPLAAALGGASIASGLTSLGVGMSLVAIGLTSDGDEKSRQIAAEIPTTPNQAFGMALDVVTGNDHKAFESSFSLIDLGVNVASLQLSSTYNIADALQLLNSIRESYSNVKESVESKLKEPIEYSNDEYEVDSH